MHFSTERPTQTLNELLVAVANEDVDAFVTLYDATSSRVFGLANRILCDAGLAEDVVQEAYLNVWTHSASFDPNKGAAAAWILAITHRRSVDRVRHEEATRRRHERLSHFYAETSNPDVALGVALDSQTDYVNRKLNECLGKLTEHQRVSLRMAYFGGLTYLQVAQQLDVPLPTVKSRIRDGLRKLHVCLEPDERDLRVEAH